MASEFLSLVDDRKQWARGMAAVQKTIGDSFAQDKSRQTDFEVRRRFKILEQVIRELRRDHGWTWARIWDALPTALRSKLDGIPWNPQTHRVIWTP